MRIVHVAVLHDVVHHGRDLGLVQTDVAHVDFVLVGTLHTS